MSMPVIVASTTTLSQALADVIESIALEEAGLSHILNAEGEKIQFFLATPGITPDQLLAVNTSVQATIAAVGTLEQALAAKLQAAISAL